MKHRMDQVDHKRGGERFQTAVGVKPNHRRGGRGGALPGAGGEGALVLVHEAQGPRDVQVPVEVLVVVGGAPPAIDALPPPNW